MTSTYVTGTWTSFRIGLVSDAHIHRRTIKEKQDTIVQAITLVAYIFGAAIEGMVVMESHFLFETAVIPASIVGRVLVVAWIRFGQTC